MESQPISVDALYYPYVTPPEDWIKQSLLLFDRVSSIVHPELAAPYEGTLGWLYEEGWWRPTSVPSDLVGGYTEEVEGALIAFADIGAYRFAGNSMPPAAELTRLYVGKLTRAVEEALLQLELAKLGRFGGHVMVHRDVAAIVLSVTAKYIAAAHGADNCRLVPSTDVDVSVAHAFGALSAPVERYRTLELLFTGLVPVPGPDVSIADVISFRRSHIDEVMALRIALDEMLEEVRRSEDPLDSLRSARIRTAAAVADLRRAAHSERLKLLAASASVLIMGAIIPTIVRAEAMPWVFSGIGTAVTVKVVERTVRRSPAVTPFAYLFRAEQAFS